MLWNVIIMHFVFVCARISLVVLNSWWTLSIWKLVCFWVMGDSFWWFITWPLVIFPKVVKMYYLLISSQPFSLFLGIISLLFFFLIFFVITGEERLLKQMGNSTCLIGSLMILILFANITASNLHETWLFSFYKAIFLYRKRF